MTNSIQENSLKKIRFKLVPVMMRRVIGCRSIRVRRSNVCRRVLTRGHVLGALVSSTCLHVRNDWSGGRAASVDEGRRSIVVHDSCGLGGGIMLSVAWTHFSTEKNPKIFLKFSLLKKANVFKLS